MIRFASCGPNDIIPLQGEMAMLVKLETKLRTDMQTGELAHDELLESFDSK
jgi:hypothetical protein